MGCNWKLTCGLKNKQKKQKNTDTRTDFSEKRLSIQVLAAGNKMNFAVLPLIVAAFFIQSVIPTLRIDFAIALLIDDFASLIIAIALSLSVPYRNIFTKITSIAYSCFCLNVLLHNAIVELRIENPEPLKTLAFVLVLTMFSLLIGSAIQMGMFQKSCRDVK